MQEEIVVKAPTTEALTPAQITQKAEDLGVTKTEMSLGRSFALSIMAGAFIAMGAMFFSLVVGDPALPFAIQRVLGGFLFRLGLILVVVAGAELFTGNTMIVMTSASKRIKWSAVWKNWIVVFFGNFLGALVIVGLVFLSDMSAMNGGQVGQTMVSVAAGKMHADWLVLFAKGIMRALPRVSRRLDGLRFKDGRRQDPRRRLPHHCIRSLRLRALRCQHVLPAHGRAARFLRHRSSGHRSGKREHARRALQLVSHRARQHRGRRTHGRHDVLVHLSQEEELAPAAARSGKQHTQGALVITRFRCSLVYRQAHSLRSFGQPNTN